MECGITEKSALLDALFKAYRKVVKNEYSAPYISKSQCNETKTSFENVLVLCKNAGIKDEEINIVECNAPTWYVNDTSRRSLYRTDKTE